MIKCMCGEELSIKDGIVYPCSNCTNEAFQEGREQKSDRIWLTSNVKPDSGVPVLIFDGYNIFIGRYVHKFTEVADCGCLDESIDFDYDEENDTYYYPEGWVENVYNWEDYNFLYIYSNKIVWSRLPKKPDNFERLIK